MDETRDTKTTTISVITPTYNQAQFIGETIESVLSQEGDFFIDYIVVNDGSTDNTLSILEKYNERIKGGAWRARCAGVTYRYFTKKNGGTASAINEGLRKAQGEVLGWICSDDYYMPGAFSAVVKAFTGDPALDFIYGDSLKIYDDGRPPKREPRPRPDETFESLRTRGNSFGFNFFSKRIFERTGFFDESFNYCWDLDQWMRIFKVGKTAYLPITLATFRIWSGSKTGSKEKKFAEERRIIRERYGGNVISPHAIYRLRGKIARPMDILQKKAPRFYNILKKTLYTAIDKYKYKSTGVQPPRNSESR